jgi:probable H4MPT-linked C1 transfer pathway protein
MGRERTRGVDIGGANLKIADASGFAASEFFPMWKESASLATRLTKLFERAGEVDRLALTMTGELADCFATKSEGVAFIADATLAAAGDREVRFWSQSRGFVDADFAKSNVLDVAAANWHATATFCGRFASEGAAIFVDAGSTTVDLIPLERGEPVGGVRTDTERLRRRQLVYTGVERTPVFALGESFVLRGASLGVAAELFATTADAYVLLGELPEDRANVDTANGKPLTKEESARRLARTFCADELEFDANDAIDLARQVRDRQASRIAESLAYVVASMSGRPRAIVLAGHGDFLIRPALELAGLGGVPTIRLTESIGAEASRAASAYALAVLAEERWR